MISVIIPMYDAQSTIIRCLNSVENQTYKGKIEILVINDGSTDDCKQLVEDYIKSHPNLNIQLVNKLNGGASSARNAGLKIAKGEFIALLDSDDYWLEDKLKRQMDVFEKMDVDFVGTLHNNLKLGFPYNTKNDLIYVSFNKMMIKMAPSTITALFKKSLIQKSGYYDENQRYCEDGNLWLRFCKNGKMVIINENFAIAGDMKPLYGHSGLSGNLVQMYRGEIKNLKDILKLKYINTLEYFFYYSYITLKFYRRLLIVKNRN